MTLIRLHRKKENRRTIGPIRFECEHSRILAWFVVMILTIGLVLDQGSRSARAQEDPKKDALPNTSATASGTDAPRDSAFSRPMPSPQNNLDRWKRLPEERLRKILEIWKDRRGRFTQARESHSKQLAGMRELEQGTVDVIGRIPRSDSAPLEAIRKEMLDRRDGQKALIADLKKKVEESEARENEARQWVEAIEKELRSRGIDPDRPLPKTESSSIPSPQGPCLTSSLVRW